MIEFALLVVVRSSLTWIWSACRPWDLERLFRRVAISSYFHGRDGDALPDPGRSKVSHDVGLANASFHESMMALNEANELSGCCGSCDRLEESNGFKGFVGGTTHRRVGQQRANPVAIDCLIGGG
jgi:hypothetical protein